MNYRKWSMRNNDSLLIDVYEFEINDNQLQQAYLSILEMKSLVSAGEKLKVKAAEEGKSYYRQKECEILE